MSRICAVAWRDCSASDLTSPATTANPRPASPALAASMPALTLSRFDCSASPLTVRTISPIACAWSQSARMRSASASIRARASCVPRTLSSTARRPSREISAVSRTSLATARAFSVVSATVWRTSSVGRGRLVDRGLLLRGAAGLLGGRGEDPARRRRSVATASCRWRVTARPRHPREQDAERAPRAPATITQRARSSAARSPPRPRRSPRSACARRRRGRRPGCATTSGPG